MVKLLRYLCLRKVDNKRTRMQTNPRILQACTHNTKLHYLQVNIRFTVRMRNIKIHRLHINLELKIGAVNSLQNAEVEVRKGDHNTYGKSTHIMP